jgi:hypothetical protein
MRIALPLADIGLALALSTTGQPRPCISSNCTPLPTARANW